MNILETSKATDTQPKDLLTLSMHVIQRNDCNQQSNLYATNTIHSKSCQVSAPMNGNYATSELRRLINEVSQLYGGDDSIFLTQYTDNVIHEWSHDLDRALICFRDLKRHIQPVITGNSRRIIMKFKPGESGNPSGRKPGTGHRQQLFKTLVEPHRDALVNTAIDLAINGNEAMLRLFLERMLPVKPNDDSLIIEMPEDCAKNASTLLEYGAIILHDVSRGNITPDQGKSVMEIIEAQRKNVETSELAARLADIERTLKQRKKEKK